MSFEDISYRNSGGHFVRQSRTFCASLVEGIRKKNSVNFFEFEPVVQEEMSFKIFLLWSSGSPSVWSGTICALLKEDIIGEHSCEVM